MSKPKFYTQTKSHDLVFDGGTIFGDTLSKHLYKLSESVSVASL